MNIAAALFVAGATGEHKAASLKAESFQSGT